MNHPDIRDFGNLLEQLRQRHTVIYYSIVVLSALGLFGLLCLVGAIK